MFVLRDRGGFCEHIGFRILVETEQRDFKAFFFNLHFTTKEGCFFKVKVLRFMNLG